MAAIVRLALTLLIASTGIARATPGGPTRQGVWAGYVVPQPGSGRRERLEFSVDMTATPAPLNAAVTVVAQAPELKPAPARVRSLTFDEGEKRIIATLSAITLPAWLTWAPPPGAVLPAFSRVLVIAGAWPRARAVAIEGLRPSALPPGTGADDALVVVDRDGDGRIDVVLRHACEHSGERCEAGYEETWLRLRRGWRRIDRRDVD